MKQIGPFCILLMSSLVAGCGMSLNIAKRPSELGADFLNSKISSSPSAQADGNQAVTVKLTFTNSDGSAVEGFLPEYEIVSGSGAITEKCTKSDAAGASNCEVKAVQSGIKKFKVTNLPDKVRLEQDLTFFTLGLTPVFVSADSAVVRSSGGSGYKMQAAVGQSMDDQKTTGAGQWKMTSSAQMTGAIQ